MPRTLRPGSRPGDDVKHAETVLRALGLFHRQPGRRYGKPAQEAVTVFKRRHKLPGDGILGPRAWVALEKAYADHLKPVKAEGVDISSFQGRPDFKRVRASGRDFVYVKATEGVTFTDGVFGQNVRDARAANMHVGAYHFLRPQAGRSGAAEAQHFAKTLAGHDLTLRPVADVEVSALGSQAVTAVARTVADVQPGAGRMGAYYHELRVLTLDAEAGRALGTYIEQFLDEAQKLLGTRPIIYTFPAFATWSSTHGADLWIAHYGVSKPTIPAPWRRYVAWQHTSSATVPGIGGRVDADHAPDLRKLRK